MPDIVAAKCAHGLEYCAEHFILGDYVHSAKGQIECFNVLIVEDDEDIRETLVECLASEGMSVAAAANGAEALAYLRANNRPDAIVLDLMMPVMDGAEFRARQLADPGLAGIPVVVLSANHDLRHEARQFGAAEVLLKPLRLELLVDALERVHAPASQRGQVASATDGAAAEGGPDPATNVRRRTLD